MPFQNAQINAAAALNWLGNFGQLGSPQIPLAFGGLISFPNAGPGDASAANLSGGTIMINMGTPVVLDLATLTAPDGSACAFTDLVAVGFWNFSTIPGENLTVGGGTNPIISIWGSGNLSILAGLDGTAAFTIATTAATGWAYNSSTAHTFQLSVAAGTGVQIGYYFLGH